MACLPCAYAQNSAMKSVSNVRDWCALERYDRYGRVAKMGDRGRFPQLCLYSEQHDVEFLSQKSLMKSFRHIVVLGTNFHCPFTLLRSILG